MTLTTETLRVIRRAIMAILAILGLIQVAAALLLG